MKKVLALFLAIMMLICSFGTMAANVSPKFTDTFFPSGKVGAPTDVYYQIVNNSDNQPIYVYIWLTQPDDVIAMFSEMNLIDDYDKWYEKYNCYLDVDYIQIDCKVDDGDWHYMPEWDKNEYPQEDQPYDLTIRQKIVADSSRKTYREGGALIDPWYGQDDENAGYLKPVIKTDGENAYLDLKNHSLTLRTRYIFGYRNDDLSDAEKEANGGSNVSYILSDWSEEITIGKNATQIELVKPNKLDAATISQLTFVESQEREKGVFDTTWKVYVDYPKSSNDAAKYYSIIEDAFDPLAAVMEYRVQTNGKWGEWKNTYWGNPEWITSGWKSFITEGVSKDDVIEFRTYLANNVEPKLNSEYSVSLFCNAGNVKPAEPTKTTTVQPGPVVPDNPDPVKDKCKVCGICPIQPLGICLFIWIAIIIVIILVLFILKKSKDKKNKGNK